jgi:hypothetical protein
MLTPGKDAEGRSPAHVQRVGRPEPLEVFGPGTDGVLEVQRIGEVELAVHSGGAREGDLAGVDVEVPLIGGPVATVGGELGHEPRDRLVNEALGLRRPGPVCEGGEHPVDVLGSLR